MTKNPDREDAVAAFALHKTVVFLIYSLLVPVVSLALGLLVGGCFCLTEKAMEHAELVLMSVFEAGLLYLVIRGALPGSRAPFVQPFSEKQIGTACSVLSAATWVFAGYTEQGNIIRIVINGSLFISTAVYFVAKSYASSKIRWHVLSVLASPMSELCYEWSRGLR